MKFGQLMESTKRNNFFEKYTKFRGETFLTKLF